METINAALAAYPESADRAAMFFLLGEIHEARGYQLDAALAYQEYLNFRPGLIDFYVYERIGDNFLQVENYQEAINAYLNAIQTASIVDTLYLNLLIGDAYLAIGDLATAQVTFQDVYDRTANDFYKAQALRKIGDIYLTQENFESAYAAYQEVVENYPLAYDAYLSLVALLDADVPVSDLDRGLINYFVQQYGFAIDAFVRYLRANPDDHTDVAHYYLGLSYQAQSEYAKAIETWQELIDDHINERFWASAFDEIAYTKSVYRNDPEGAIETYLEFVDRSPLDERAPEFLYYAARTAERNFDLSQAARLWERVGTQFSTSSWAFDGLFQAGITRYRLGEFDNAISLFQSSLGVAKNPGNQAAAYFWIGKSYQMLGNPGAAEDSWRQAVTSDPTGYYSERSEDILAGIPPFSPPNSYNLNINLSAEKIEANEWMHTTFNIPDEVDLNNITPLLSDPRMVRGTELWNLQQFEDARLEFESLRQDIKTDPAQTYRLTNYLYEIGLYRSSILAARTVLDLAGLDDAGTFNAPIYFNHIRFGPYYLDIVAQAAQENNLHPLFLLSVMRQESLFEGFVTSTAGARGLMQIIPSTGEDIARLKAWPANYTSEDLYRPLVNINYGAFYLNQQRNGFGGDIPVALAAYNGGPGNASRWLQLTNSDLDLYVEVIRFEETRNYIRYIYELYTIYKGLYSQ
jgi:soluble lytic murein transglycosylase